MSNGFGEPEFFDPGEGPQLPALAQGRTLQQVRTGHATAVSVQQPRTLVDVKRRLLDEARLAGAEFYYGWGAGKDRIEGPSVELAIAAARAFGNCAVEYGLPQETDEAWYLVAKFIDLETGFTMERPFRQAKKWVVHGRMDDQRKDDVRFQIGASKAARNVILRCLPKSLIDAALDAAKSGVRERIDNLIKSKGLAGAAETAIEAMAKVGVKEPQILKKFGVVDRRGLNAEHLVIMRGDLHAIQEGQEYPDALYPQSEEEKAAEAKKKADDLLDKARGGAGTTEEKAPKKGKVKTPAAVEQSPGADYPLTFEQLIIEVSDRAGKGGVANILQEFSVSSLDELAVEDLQKILVKLEKS